MKKLSTALLMACTFALGLIAYTPAASADCELNVTVINKTGKKVRAKVVGYRKGKRKQASKTIAKKLRLDVGKQATHKGTFTGKGKCNKHAFSAAVEFRCVGGKELSTKQSAWTKKKGDKLPIAITLESTDCK